MLLVSGRGTATAMTHRQASIHDTSVPAFNSELILMPVARAKPFENPVADAIARCRHGLIGVGFFSVLMNLLLLTGPFFMLQIYDRVLTSRSVPTLLALSLIAIGLYMFHGGFDWMRSRLLTRLAKSFDRSIADSVFRLGSGPNAGSAQAPAQDLRQVQQFIAGPSLATLFDVPWFPIYLGVIFLLHPTLGLLGLGGAMVLVVIAVLNQLFSASKTARAGEYASREELLMRAGRQQYEPMAAMGMLENARLKWRDQHDGRIDAQTDAGDRQAIFSSTSKSLRLMLQSAILGVGAFLVIGNELSAGALIAASIIFARALAPLDQSIAQWRTIAAAATAYGRLRRGLVHAQLPEDGTALALPCRSLSISELFVAAPDRSAVLIEGAAFTLNAGDALGVIGPSGGGKSTLIKGVLGLWPTTRGEVRFDGATIDQWPARVRGQIIGYLPQDIELFPGTIAQNIARFDPEAPSKAIRDAAELAKVHDLIVGKPDGFDTVVGPGGLSLSAGERQRVALARAVYGSPFLVVLDEPNSNMDGVGEQALSETINRLRENGSIVIVVTHRSGVLSQVNKLVHVEGKRLTAFGDTRSVLEELRKRASAAKSGALRVVD